ncbi:MAG: hypothetical protein ABIC82_04925 [bacterium]
MKHENTKTNNSLFRKGGWGDFKNKKLKKQESKKTDSNFTE